MSTTLEQARAVASARRFLLDLCIPGKIKKIPRAVRQEARARVKHMPMSWDIPRIARDQHALCEMQELEAYYRNQFWEECGIDGRER